MSVERLATREQNCPVCLCRAMRFNVSEDESKLVCDGCLYEAWGLPPIAPSVLAQAEEQQP